MSGQRPEQCGLHSERKSEGETGEGGDVGVYEAPVPPSSLFPPNAATLMKRMEFMCAPCDRSFCSLILLLCLFVSTAA